MNIKQYQCVVCLSKTDKAHGVRIGNEIARLGYCGKHRQEADEIVSAVSVGIACQEACYKEALRREKSQNIQIAKILDMGGRRG